MKINNIILLSSVAMLFSFVGCGGTADRQVESETQKSTQNSLELNEDNYLNLARHYYAQSSLAKTTISSRSMRHLSASKTNRDKSADKNSFYVKLNRSDDGKVESMIIKKGNRLISVDIDNDNVKVALHGTKKVTRQTLNIDAFNNLDIQEN